MEEKPVTKLRALLSLRVVIPFSLLLFTAVSAVYNLTTSMKRIEQQVIHDVSLSLVVQMDHLVGILERDLRIGNLTGLEQAISSMGSAQHIQEFLLIDDQNSIINSIHYSNVGQEVLTFLPSLLSESQEKTLSLLDKIRKSRSSIIEIHRNKEFIFGYFPITFGAQKGSLRPSLIGVLFVQYEIASIKKTEIKNLYRQVLGYSLFLVCASVMLGLFFHFSLTRRISHIVLIEKRFSLGEMNARTGMQSADEIGQIGFAFDQMAEKLSETLVDLKNSKLQLETANKTLEEKVEERTQELKNAQSKLIQSEKMSAVGQLAAGVAHELNNPLGVIMGFAQCISERVPSGDPLEMPIKSIERESIRCKNLVQDLLIFSRTDTDKADHKLVDLNKTIEATIKLIEASAKMNSIEIAMELSPNLPSISGNQNQIQQVIINLANNAIDAMTKKGTLRIATETLQGPFPWACLKVSDTGDGIPKEIQSKIFEPFFTTKPVGKGTGLGLSLIFEIVKKHSGTIEVMSRPGLTEFFIKFPIPAG